MVTDVRRRSSMFISGHSGTGVRQVKRLIWIGLASCVLAAPAPGAEPVLTIETPMSPPTWALLERELLRANTAACREFFEKYLDDRGYLLCVERWGGDDGPDDAIENCTG